MVHDAHGENSSEGGQCLKYLFLGKDTSRWKNRADLIERSSFLAPKYKFGDKWYTIDGQIRQSTLPESLKSDGKLSYTQVEDANDNSGVYPSSSHSNMWYKPR